MYIGRGLAILLISLNLSLSVSAGKHFAVDIDYTFYVKDKSVFENNVASFKKLKDNGITPFFCTGRVHSSAMAAMGEGFIQQTGYNGYPGVYANGAVVYDSDGNIIDESHFTQDFLKKFVDHLGKNNLVDSAVFNENGKFYKLTSLRENFKKYVADKNIVDIDDVKSEDLFNKKIHIIIINKSVDIPELNGEYVSRSSYTNGTQYITAKKASKEKGLKKLLDHLKVDYGKCAFIADGDNDVEAIKMCNPSYAVGNAVDGVKKQAKIVLNKKYDEGAFADAVDMFLKEQTQQKPVNLTLGN